MDAAALDEGSAPAAFGWRRLPLAWVLAGLTAAALGVVVLGVVAGSVGIAPAAVARVVGERLLPGVSAQGVDPVQARIVWEFRLPRALLGLVVGATLAVAGAVLQATVRNPLADPFVLGVSSGASVGAVMVLTLAGTAGVAGAALGGLSVSAAAFAGALVTALVVYLFAQRRGSVEPTRLVLAGVSVGYVLSAVVSFLVLRAAGPGTGISSVLTWLAGSLGGAQWADLGLPTAVLLTGLVALLGWSRHLDALQLGDETAVGLGIDVNRTRLALFALTSLLVGVAVAVSGAIGFVGLVVPHAVRAVLGPGHGRLLPVAALVGGSYLVLVDLAARVVLAPTELPVGLVTAVLGGPVFLWLLRTRLGAR